MCQDVCAKTVQTLLAKQPGVLDARVDFPAGLATVAVTEGEFDPEAAIASLADFKFEAALVEGDEPTVE